MSSNKTAIENIIISIIPPALKAFRDEVKEQNFVLTGKLIKDIDTNVLNTLKGFVIQFLIKDYGVYLDKGVSPNKVPYNPGSGAKKSKYITGLIRWARLKFGANKKSAKSIAFAVARIHKKEGIASKGSRAFSKNGKRGGFIEDSLIKIEKDLINYLTTEIINFVLNIKIV